MSSSSSWHGSPHIAIAGAGLGGALLACFLGRRGHRVTLYERRADPRKVGFVGGRSINLALSTRGLHALGQVGLADAVLADAIPMRGRMMHSTTGQLTFQPYSKNRGEAINSVSRGGLNVTLLDAAESYDSVEIVFGHRCIDADIDAPSALFRREETGDEVTVDCDLLIGADGAFSAVRGCLQRTDRFDYSQSYLEHGYKELTIPATAGGDFAMEPEALHIWPRGGFMMIALPNRDRTFTCTLFWPFRGPHGFERLDSPEALAGCFREQFADAVPLIPKLFEDYFANPVGSLVTVRCNPWHHRDRVLLVGDACHAIVPFYGQGMNAAFEDCTVLDACIERHGTDWGAVLASFTETRRVDADAIADLALANFIEMRDKVGSRVFLMKKRLEKVLHRLMPRRFTPLYNMVTFSNIPYDAARRKAARQEHALRSTAAGFAALLVVTALIVAAVIYSSS